MSRPKKYASAADRQAAYRAKRNETGVTKPCYETMLRNETPVGAGAVTKPCDETPVEEAETLTQAEAEAQRLDVPPSSFVPFRHQPHVPLALFDGFGRGTVRTHTDGRQYVLVSRHTGPDVGELGVVSATDWSVRLAQRCEHGHAGWSCHRC